MPIYEDNPMQYFPDYIPWIREDAKAVRVDCTPRYKMSVSGIALPLYPSPDWCCVFSLCDWMPAVYWRKNAVFNHRRETDWHVFRRVHISRITEIADVRFCMNQWGHYSVKRHDLPGLEFQHDLFPHIEGRWSIEDDYVRSIRSWTLNGWYVKDEAMPICYHTQKDASPPLYAYENCMPLAGAKALERRMKLPMRIWQPDFSNAGAMCREENPDILQDDVEIAASFFCENYVFLDFSGNRMEPSQKAVTWLYTVFCASAGYLV